MVWARQLASKQPCTVGDFCCSPSASRNATFWTSIPWRSATAKNGASPFRFWLQLEKRSIFGRPKDPRGSTLHEDTRRCWWIGRGETDLRQQLFLKKTFCKWQWRTTGKLIQIQKSHHNHHIFHFASQVSKSSWETCQKSAAASGLPAYPPEKNVPGSDGFRYQKAPKQSQRWSYSQYQSCIELDTQRPKDNSNLLHYRGDVCKAQSHLLSRGYPTPARPSCHCKGHHPQPELQP